MVLVTGSSVSQFITFLTIPILSRLFTPADFGLFAIFVSISTIIATIATFRYDYAIMLPKKNDQAANLLSLSFLTLLVSIAVTSIIILLFNQHIAALLNNNDILPWLYFIPLNVLTIAAIQSLSYWMNRQKKYKSIASNHIVRSIAYPTATISIKHLSNLKSALIPGYLFSQTVHLLLFLFQARKSIFKYSHAISINNLKKCFFQYKDFPLKNLPATLLSIMSFQIPLLLLGVLFTSSTLGQYSQTLQILFAPINLIGSAVSQVFYQHASIAKREKMLFQLTRSTTIRLFGLAIIPFTTVAIWGKPLITCLLGENWSLAGEIAQILAPYFLLRFIFFSQISILSTIRKNGLEATLNLALMISQVGAVLIGYYIFNSAISVFWLMSASATCIYTICGFMILISAYRNDFPQNCHEGNRINESR